MATGIFSTTRVAGEGIALAIVTALLAGLAQHRLARLTADGSPAMTQRIAEAAQRLTTGDLASAAASLPQISRHELALSYTHAFTSLLHVLIVITLLSACASFAFLSRTGARDNERNGHDEPLHEVEESAVV